MRTALLCLLLIALLGSCSRDPEPSEMSVLLVTLDTTRTERLGCYGRVNAATPNLDALAADGVLFEQAYTVAPITLPAHASILTGTTPLEHRVRDNRGFRVPETSTTLAEVLRDAGYRTGAFLGAFPLAAKFGLNQGFERYDDRWSGDPGFRFEFPERRAEEVVAAATRWIGDVPEDQPLFAWVHLFDPHEAYQPPAPFDSAFRTDPYQGEIAYMDHCLERLLETLERTGRSDDTLIIVVADHGEGLGDHGERNHVTLVYNTTVRVPLIVRGPGVPKGQRVPQTASTIDLVPTVTDLLGLEPPNDAAGESLVELWQDSDAAPRTAYFESSWPQLQQGWSELQGITRGRWKLIEAPAASQVELYDIARDPGEQNDLAAEEPERVADLRARLDELRQRSRASVESKRQPSPQDLEMLRQLGYAGKAADAEESGRHPREMVSMLSELAGVMQHIDAGRLERALAVLDRMENRYPGATGIHEYRALCYAELGQQEPVYLEKAAAELLICLSRNPDVPLFWKRLGEVRRQQSDFGGAGDAYAAVVAMDPRDLEAATAAGELYLQASDVESAIAVFEKAAPGGELDAEIEIGHATALAAARRYDEAAPRYRRVIDAPDATRDQRFRAINRLGLVQREQERYLESIASFRRALELDPGNPVARSNLASALERAGRRREAQQLYEQLAREQPEQPYYRQKAEALR